MNKHLPFERLRRDPTQAAEGLPRWRWSTAELERMAGLGVFSEDDRFELIGGEIVPMSPKGNFHEVLRNQLSFVLARLCPPDIRVAFEPQFNLAPDTYTHPDILVHKAVEQVPFVKGDTALLVIEVAESSLSFDLKAKALLYARHGVREYWVIDAKRRITRVHRDPEAGGFGHVHEAQSRERLVPALAPTLAVALDELTLD
ncbi:MAG TPA: Uma2 family endonuclease [Hyphomicrobiaceae bacterium]|nr:Uma2 family endonuclease [Hyphomicrobiaceae bacterium]